MVRSVQKKRKDKTMGFYDYSVKTGKGETLDLKVLDARHILANREEHRTHARVVLVEIRLAIADDVLRLNSSKAYCAPERGRRCNH